MLNGFNKTSSISQGRFALLAVGGLVVILSGLLLPQLLLKPEAQIETEVVPTANQPTPFEVPSPSEVPSLTMMFIRFAAGFVIVCGSIVVTTKYLKRPKRHVRQEPVNPFKILGSMPIGRGMVYHVQIGDQHLLAGTDAFGFKKLISIPAVPEAQLPPDLHDMPKIISERVSVSLPV